MRQEHPKPEINLVVKFIILILLTLIKIGDAVLWVLNKIITGAQIALFFLVHAAVSIRKAFAQAFILLSNTLQAILRLAQIISLRPKTPTIVYQKIQVKKRVKPEPIPVFSFSFVDKFKYFVAGTLFSFVFLFVPLLFLLFIQDLPSPKELTLRPAPQTTKIFDRNGTLLYQIYAAENRTSVPLSEIPRSLQLATIAIEDKDFYKHPGFDVTAIIRSAFANAKGEELQGGSTITQQLIKSSLLSPETSFWRKIKEVVLAFWAERLYTKDQILEFYFNQVAYGGTAYGAETASQVYFGKHVRDLDVAQSAFLAGIPRAPTIYSPYGANPTLWKKRQKEVLARMTTLGYITKDEQQKALDEELDFKPPQVPLYAPHFVMYVRDLLIKKYGLQTVERGGLTVVTSLDLKINDMAQKIVTEEVQNNASLHLTNGAAMVTNPQNGDILAMIGSKDFHDPAGGNVNVATSLRQPGSSIKIVTYAAAMSGGMTAATIIDDSPITYASPGGPSYSPVNYDGRFHGRVPLRLAFANSFNIPAVKTLNQIGIPTMVHLAKKMGITTWSDPSNYGLSLTLGSAETTMVDMTSVYGVFPNQGYRVTPNPFLRVLDAKGNVLEEKTSVEKERVLDEGITYIISNILSDNGARAWEFGSNSPLQIPGHTVSVKTGTSDNKRDNWTFGYTKNYLVGVWVGNNDNSPMSQSLASGITGAAPIWNKIMTNLLSNTKDQPFPRPANVIQKQCLGRMEYFIKGTENSVNCAPLPPSPSVSPSPAH